VSSLIYSSPSFEFIPSNVALFDPYEDYWAWLLHGRESKLVKHCLWILTNSEY
jgi:hypothetical protein